MEYVRATNKLMPKSSMRAAPGKVMDHTDDIRKRSALNYLKGCFVLLGLNAFLLAVIIQKLSTLIYNVVMLRGAAI